MLALAGSGDPSSHSASTKKWFRHKKNQSGKEVALSNGEDKMFRNRLGNLYERNKRNPIGLGGSCATVVLAWKPFRHFVPEPL
ncbi:MAG: hypothetical protein CMJ30_08290 [Phycisphaerae bacterium]|nr:hypothetical protein [Phycisphaerae bacterium]